MSLVDRAYAAGLIDGEGSVCLTRTQPKGYRYPTVSASSTTRELLEFLQETFGGSISVHKTPDGCKPSWSWDIRSRQALEFLRLVSGFMREPYKVARATKLLDEYDTVTIRNGKYSDEGRTAKLRFEEQFLAIK